MTTKETVLDILEYITGSDEVKENLEVDLFDEGLMDSLATVQLLVELEGQLGVQVPVSEFDRTEWNTPAKIISKVDSLQA
ncbi:D-alanine-poly(phosphoribitol) ligase, subunit 2 [Enterococcus phoeniculicola]|jgi:D-alanine--poly(phosphoribitol) ligase subunit 2|uniref:D-alanyl carrier protein n=1 Tax=Enterococcus phoeniculicola ATCC BAA-412 TaxID=1158610 RepID=R3W6F6_9ENTE|nr:D-alanine--poly(phosphoribitol) ligase subunit DltC [Enterococcus phoeniculicola]EOL43157.1 D-alanine-poly(phosphoribitol) ligase, subunit 2 [Enterococcus phoeniculicola ATCC BAA-412]EOT76485.1 D-alanine-poly(phosphoribitol) ligase, subunit 2 [Enterococcus phoeniculicola ATCC BAA-412]OJG71102.1 D-alanine-poly(phosphoribitol) ligase, subunit 2 [Enterococcus phoeniculicola]